MTISCLGKNGRAVVVNCGLNNEEKSNDLGKKNGPNCRNSWDRRQVCQIAHTKFHHTLPGTYKLTP